MGHAACVQAWQRMRVTEMTSVASSSCDVPNGCNGAAQMGGAQGVREKEVYFVTIQPKDALNMHVIPRLPPHARAGEAAQPAPGCP